MTISRPKFYGAWVGLPREQSPTGFDSELWIPDSKSHPRIQNSRFKIFGTPVPNPVSLVPSPCVPKSRVPESLMPYRAKLAYNG
jgi:hypothetical protein